MADIFSWAYQIGLKFVDLGSTLYDIMMTRIDLPSWISDTLRFFGLELYALDFWVLLGGGGILLFILWSIFGW